MTPIRTRSLSRIDSNVYTAGLGACRCCRMIGCKINALLAAHLNAVRSCLQGERKSGPRAVPCGSQRQGVGTDVMAIGYLVRSVFQVGVPVPFSCAPDIHPPPHSQRPAGRSGKSGASTASTTGRRALQNWIKVGGMQELEGRETEWGRAYPTTSRASRA